MEDRKEHGLGLEVSISDAGTGLNAGIPRAFPDICVQPDIFHELRPVGTELARLERKAEKLISDEAGLEKRASGKAAADAVLPAPHGRKFGLTFTGKGDPAGSIQHNVPAEGLQYIFQ